MPLSTNLLSKSLFPETIIAIIPSALATSLLVVGVVVLLCGAVFILNTILDIYGVFGSTQGRRLPVYYKEKISKFLLAERYIPENYNAVILGTSLSDNLDVTKLNDQSKKFRFYNASVMGIDINGLAALTEKVVKGGVKNVVICVSPYILKTDQTGNIYKGSFSKLRFPGTAFLLQTYFVALVRKFNLMPSKFPKNQYNSDGVHNYYSLFKITDIHKKMAEVIEDNLHKPIVKEPQQLKKLNQLVGFLKASKVNFLLYFHPLPLAIYESKKQEYERFHSEVRSFLTDEQRIIDFNRPEFASFTEDYSNYMDHGHLSHKGQAQISSFLLSKLESLQQERNKVALVA